MSVGVGVGVGVDFSQKQTQGAQAHSGALAVKLAQEQTRRGHSLPATCGSHVRHTRIPASRGGEAVVF